MRVFFVYKPLIVLFSLLGTMVIHSVAFGNWYGDYSPWESGQTTSALNNPVINHDSNNESNTSTDPDVQKFDSQELETSNINSEGSDIIRTGTSDSRVTLELFSEASIKGTRVIVSDIANCSGSKISCDQVYTTDLGFDMSRQGSRIISRAFLQSLLLSNGVSRVGLTIVGATSVKIERKSYLVISSEIRSDIKQKLESALRCEDECDFEIHVPNIHKNYRVYEKDWAIKIDGISDLVETVETVTRSKSFKIDWFFSSSPQLRNSIFVKIDRLKGVLVFREAFKKGHEVFAKDLVYRKEKMSDVPVNYFPIEFSGQKYVLKRNVAAGQIASDQTVYIPYVIKRGQEIDVISNSGSLKVKVKGKSLNDGRIGEVISIRIGNKMSKKTTGIVRSSSVAEIM